MSRMTQDIYNRWTEWERRQFEDPDLTREMREIMADPVHRDERIHDCCYKDLEFGTGGLREIMGIGTNRMNICTVSRASRGYAAYLKERLEECPGPGGAKGIKLAVAYDSRLKSRDFARVAAEVFAASGFQVYMFPELAPTPMLSYAVRYLGCDGGVMITASHNPAQYNGYKVYGPDGGQITGETAKGISAKISQMDLFSDENRLGFDAAVQAGKIAYIDNGLVDAYYQAVSGEAFGGGIDRNIKIVYSPLNGTGLKPVCGVLERNGFTNISVVEEQREPDGHFSTCPVPNPEKAEAMALAIRDAKRLGSQLVLATDPDCDRVGIGVRTLEGDYRLLSGNETGVLLLDYVARRRRESGTMPAGPISVKTIVTSDLAGKVAQSYGIEMRDVLTGFKYIGEQIGLLEADGGEGRFILGLEESYGYLSGTYVRDKDGVNASLLICEMAGYYSRLGMTLEQVLENLYQRYGYYLNTQYTCTFSGEEGTRRMEVLMEEIRREMVSFPDFAGNRMVKADDYWHSCSYLAEGEKISLKLPASNVVKMTWEDGSTLTVRPSGTEPKLKIYITAIDETREKALHKEQKIKQEIWFLPEILRKN